MRKLRFRKVICSRSNSLGKKKKTDKVGLWIEKERCQWKNGRWSAWQGDCYLKVFSNFVIKSQVLEPVDLGFLALQSNSLVTVENLLTQLSLRFHIWKTEIKTDPTHNVAMKIKWNNVGKAFDMIQARSVFNKRNLFSLLLHIWTPGFGEVTLSYIGQGLFLREMYFLHKPVSDRTREGSSHKWRPCSVQGTGNAWMKNVIPEPKEFKVLCRSQIWKCVILA